MYVATAEQMRQADRLAIQKYGIPAPTLMENAGRGAFEILQKKFPDLRDKKVFIIAGKGNNGGDGRVLGRLLNGVAKEVQVADVGAWQTGSLQEYDIVVDAIFGTGLSRPVEGPAKEAIEAINRAGKWVMALDIPSGLSADTGKPLGAAVRADLTGTMGLPKLGPILPEAADYVGDLEIIDIGIPKEVYEGMSLKVHWIAEREIRPLFTPRKKDSHKGSYGHLLLIGGSATKPGAILMAGRAALRTGAGLVTVALPDKAFRKFPKNFLELMYEPLPSTPSGTLSRKGLKKLMKIFEGKSAVAAGPGMGVNGDTKAIVTNLLKGSGMSLVLDADALNCVAAIGPGLLNKRPNVIVTPHPGEMARLMGKKTLEIQANRIEVARTFAVNHGVHLVLKGFRTVIANPEGEVFINSTGNPGMATAGMGDVLTGIIGSLIAQGMELEKAVIAGVYLHGRAGDRVAERLGDRGLLASDVIEEIPTTIKELLSH
jgi:NAD(P)H-hydrate epimerase